MLEISEACKEEILDYIKNNKTVDKDALINLESMIYEIPTELLEDKEITEELLLNICTVNGSSYASQFESLKYVLSVIEQISDKIKTKLLHNINNISNIDKNESYNKISNLMHIFDELPDDVKTEEKIFTNIIEIDDSETLKYFGYIFDLLPNVVKTKRTVTSIIKMNKNELKRLYHILNRLPISLQTEDQLLDIFNMDKDKLKHLSYVLYKLYRYFSSFRNKTYENKLLDTFNMDKDTLYNLYDEFHDAEDYYEVMKVLRKFGLLKE